MERSHKEPQLRRLPFDESEKGRLRPQPLRLAAYEQVKDVLLVEPGLQPLRLPLHAWNGEQVVVAVWQFVGNLKFQNHFTIEHSPKKIITKLF